MSENTDGDRPRLFSRRAELRAIGLARRQPESTEALNELIEAGRDRLVARVLADGSLKARLATARHRLVGVDYREAKSDRGSSEPDRLAEVGFYDYDRNSLVVALTDLGSGTVRQIDEREGMQPPLSVEELEDARQILGADGAYKRLARKSLRLTALPARASFSEDHPAYRHRCFAVSAWSGKGKPRSGKGKPRLEGTVLVDLSDRRVVPGGPGDLRPPEAGDHPHADRRT